MTDNDTHRYKMFLRVRELDPIMRNIFDDKPGKLAVWLSASRVERAPRRTTPTPPPTPPTS